MVRTLAQRIADTLEHLDRERTCWLAVSRADGSAHLIPLTYCWDGERIIVATRRRSVTVAGVERGVRVRLSLPSTSDVVIVEATGEVVPVPQIEASIDRLFRLVAGFDPAREDDYVYIVFRPLRVLAWRDEAELPTREIMQGGVWRREG